MKKVFSLAIIASLLVVGCHKNDDHETVLQIEQNQVSTANNLRSIDQTEALESMLQWTAYMTAQGISHDNLAEDQFIDVLQNDTSSPYKIIDLNDLLGYNVENPSFRRAFREQFLRFSGLDCNDDGNDDFNKGPIEGSPKPSPPVEIGNPTTCNGAFVNFLAALLDFNCLEIYLPLGYNENVNGITSTAHPLNLNSWNDCYKHPHDTPEQIIISLLNINDYDNPLMVRPVRYPDEPILDSYCTYPDYEGIDFTLFLDN